MCRPFIRGACSNADCAFAHGENELVVIDGLVPFHVSGISYDCVKNRSQHDISQNVEVNMDVNPHYPLSISSRSKSRVAVSSCPAQSVTYSKNSQNSNNNQSHNSEEKLIAPLSPPPPPPKTDNDMYAQQQHSLQQANLNTILMMLHQHQHQQEKLLKMVLPILNSNDNNTINSFKIQNSTYQNALIELYNMISLMHSVPSATTDNHFHMSHLPFDNNNVTFSSSSDDSISSQFTPKPLDVSTSPHSNLSTAVVSTPNVSNTDNNTPTIHGKCRDRKLNRNQSNKKHGINLDNTPFPALASPPFSCSSNTSFSSSRTQSSSNSFSSSSSSSYLSSTKMECFLLSKIKKSIAASMSEKAKLALITNSNNIDFSPKKSKSEDFSALHDKKNNGKALFQSLITLLTSVVNDRIENSESNSSSITNSAESSGSSVNLDKLKKNGFYFDPALHQELITFLGQPCSSSFSSASSPTLISDENEEEDTSINGDKKLPTQLEYEENDISRILKRELKLKSKMNMVSKSQTNENNDNNIAAENYIEDDGTNIIYSNLLTRNGCCTDDARSPFYKNKVSDAFNVSGVANNNCADAKSSDSATVSSARKLRKLRQQQKLKHMLILEQEGRKSKLKPESNSSNNRTNLENDTSNIDTASLTLNEELEGQVNEDEVDSTSAMLIGSSPPSTAYLPNKSNQGREPSSSKSRSVDGSSSGFNSALQKDATNNSHSNNDKETSDENKKQEGVLDAGVSEKLLETNKHHAIDRDSANTSTPLPVNSLSPAALMQSILMLSNKAEAVKKKDKFVVTMTFNLKSASSNKQLILENQSNSSSSIKDDEVETNKSILTHNDDADNVKNQQIDASLMQQLLHECSPSFTKESTSDSEFNQKLGILSRKLKLSPLLLNSQSPPTIKTPDHLNTNKKVNSGQKNKNKNKINQTQTPTHNSCLNSTFDISIHNNEESDSLITPPSTTTENQSFVFMNHSNRFNSTNDPEQRTFQQSHNYGNSNAAPSNKLGHVSNKSSNNRSKNLLDENAASYKIEPSSPRILTQDIIFPHQQQNNLSFNPIVNSPASTAHLNMLNNAINDVNSAVFFQHHQRQQQNLQALLIQQQQLQQPANGYLSNLALNFINPQQHHQYLLWSSAAQAAHLAQANSIMSMLAAPCLSSPPHPQLPEVLGVLSSPSPSSVTRKMEE